MWAESSDLAPPGGRGTGSQASASEAEPPQYRWVAEDENFSQLPGKATLKLQFMSETGTARPSGASRDLIRSHARRKPKSRLSLLVGNEKTDGEPEKRFLGTQPTSKSRRMVAATSMSSIVSSPQRHMTGHGDPFDTLPVDFRMQIHGMLDFWNESSKNIHGPLAGKEKWVQFAVFDPVFINIVLWTAAQRISALRKEPPAPEVFYYQGKTIRAINDSLSELKNGVCASDGLITAIGGLALNEAFTANHKGAKIHMDCLESLVKCRGGLQVLGSYGIPRRQISWTDAAAATLLGTKHRFEQILSSGHVDPAGWNPYNSWALCCMTKLSELTGSEVLSKEIITIYWGLRNISLMKDQGLFRPALNLDNAIPVIDLIEQLERRLAAVQAACASMPHQDSAIYSLFAYAAILHSYRFLREVPPSALALLHIVSLRIQEVLGQADVPKLKMHHPEMLLWITMMGGMNSSSPVRDWFVTDFTDFCLELGIRGRDQIALALSESFWSELYRRPVTTSFWADAARAHDVQGSTGVERPPHPVAAAVVDITPRDRPASEAPDIAQR